MVTTFDDSSPSSKHVHEIAQERVITGVYSAERVDADDMTDVNTLYAELKPDLEAVANPLFDFSQECLRKNGNFLPHAAVLTDEGKVELIGAVPESGDGMTNSTAVLPLIHSGLRAQVKQKALSAVGVAENVTVTPEGQAPTQAIKVLFEHRRGLTVALYLPFRRTLLRKWVFGDVFSVLAKPEVNPWATPPDEA